MAQKNDSARAQGSAVSENVRDCPTEKNRLNETPPSPSFTEQVQGAELTPQQLAAVDLLAQGVASHLAVARTVKVDPRTLYRWRQQPHFAQLLASRRAELWTDVAGRLRGMVHECLDVIGEQLRDNYDTSRFKAAKTLLTMLDLKKTVAALDEDPGPPREY